MPPRPARTALLLAALLAPAGARADEGMWTFDAFPSASVEASYGFAPGGAWLDHVRRASARLAFGCSGSFVSAGGLLLTNHHCAHACVEQASTAERDLVKGGFSAGTPADEARCPDLEVDQLTSIVDVTAQVRAATRGLEGAAYQGALRAETARLEKACQASEAVRCDLVTLYRGGLFHLYVYRRFQDVRLVFVPEIAAAFFGGDPDNFEFPRYDLDLAFLRVYEGGRPARTPDFFPLQPRGAAPGELTFVTGHPGGTDRGLTVAQLAHRRDVALPARLLRLAEERGLLLGFRLLGEEERRISTETLYEVENSLKALRGEAEALRDPALLARKQAEEQALRGALARAAAGTGPTAEAAARALPAFAALERALARLRELHVELAALEHGPGGELFDLARAVLRAAAERGKPDGERLREYRDAALPALAQRVLSEAPIHPSLERVLLGRSLARLREDLGPDHPAVRRLLGRDAPEELAARAVAGTRLAEVEARRALWEGGAAAVAASDDPMLALARALDPDARAVRRAQEDEVEAVVGRAEEALAEARLALQGRASYPDATFTLRLSYGTVKGWREGAREVPPFTTLGGAFERATGKDPFALPESWLRAKGRLDLSTPLNLVTTNDIVGGNSGSPVVNARAELVGLVFDGNRRSLGGDLVYDAAGNRAVAVDVRAILETLRVVYGAERLLAELGAKAR